MTFDLKNLTEGQARQMRRQLKAANYEESLYNFTQRAWREIDSAPFAEGGFALQAICEHLQACVDGYIRNLIINVPPRFSKSTITGTMFPPRGCGRKASNRQRPAPECNFCIAPMQ